jgi:peptidoglycan/xylan/chitin deacetylase (PgdA/CDA1 family)
MDLARRLSGLIARKLPVRPARLPAGRGVASITFDDFPKSAWTRGGTILARHAVRGTYYTAGGFCGRVMDGTTYYDDADLRALLAAGHEIGCHGYSHQPTPELAGAALAEDARRNGEFLRPFIGRAVSYAFPFGAVSPRTKRFYAPRFASLRGVHPGVNQGRADLAQLSTISLEDRCFSRAAVDAAIARVKARGGWLVFHTHDVDEAPTPYGTTPQALDWTVARVKAAGLDFLPMREALDSLLAG